jgi:hypothetical protein
LRDIVTVRSADSTAASLVSLQQHLRGGGAVGSAASLTRARTGPLNPTTLLTRARTSSNACGPAMLLAWPVHDIADPRA